MPKVVFVILHYLTIDVTMQCIKSIENYITYDNYKIVVVDNGSNNQTGEQLSKTFKDNKYIEIIRLDDNLGFSTGNNAGYSYAKEKLHADYVIVINNDTEMIQKDFVQKAIQCFENEKYYVLGPDIINLEGTHQSPQRDHIITKSETYRWYIKRCLFSKYLHLHRILKLSNSFFILRKYLEHDENRKKSLVTDKKKESVELQGACFIFSPLYIAESKFAFEELTFMYGEEALLALRCAKNQWKILYNPDLKIKHAEKATMSIINKNLLEKEIFWSDNHVKAIKAILRKVRSY